MSIRLRSAASAFLLGLFVLGATQPSPAGETHKVGRVTVEALNSESLRRLGDIRDIVQGRFEDPTAELTPAMRVLRVTEDAARAGHYRAVVYDYTLEKAIEVTLDETGGQLSSRAIDIDTFLFANEELRDAEAIVRAATPWKDALASGSLRCYPPMPPVTIDEKGRRLINIGIMTNVQGGFDKTDKRFHAGENEIVSVSMANGEIVRYEEGAPAMAAAKRGTQCGGANFSSCSNSSASGLQQYEVTWPDANGWRFKVTRPEDTTYAYSLGTGLELTDVYYHGHLVLKKANMPVLNVLYESGCGPYRDWLFSENCFAASGTDVASGIRVGASPTDAPAATICESGSDAGAFNGVAIHDDGTDLTISTESDAGWYRYVMRWRFSPDGKLEPIFGFGDTINSCVCIKHRHHAYWRFEFAIDGDASIANTGITTAERIVPDSDQWTQLTTEVKGYRPLTAMSHDAFRFVNPVTGYQGIVAPGKTDGDANDDAYAKGDFWLLAYNPGEEDDARVNTTINVDHFINSEAIGTTKRSVLWYHAEFFHDQVNGIPAVGQCGLVGPSLNFSEPFTTGNAIIIK